MTEQTALGRWVEGLIYHGKLAQLGVEQRLRAYRDSLRAEDFDLLPETLAPDYEHVFDCLRFAQWQAEGDQSAIDAYQAPQGDWKVEVVSTEKLPTRLREQSSLRTISLRRGVPQKLSIGNTMPEHFYEAIRGGELIFAFETEILRQLLSLHVDCEEEIWHESPDYLRFTCLKHLLEACDSLTWELDAHTRLEFENRGSFDTLLYMTASNAMHYWPSFPSTEIVYSEEVDAAISAHFHSWGEACGWLGNLRTAKRTFAPTEGSEW